MEDLKHIRWITANYYKLQGLKRLPWYIWLLTIGSVYTVAFPDSMPVNSLLDLSPCLPLLLSAVIPGWVSKQIGEYYKRTFGQVHFGKREKKHSSRDIHWGIMPLILALAFLSFYVLVPFIFRVESLIERLQINETLLYTTVMLIFPNVWNKGRISIHYLIITIILVALATLPLTGLLPEDFELGPFGLPLDLIAGCLALIVAGICDHLTLVRTLKRIPEDSNASGV